MVIETSPLPQKFLLGFQIKPDARLDAVVQQALTMLKLRDTQPQFGLKAADFVDPQCLTESTQALLDSECDLRLFGSTTSVLFGHEVVLVKACKSFYRIGSTCAAP
jgi:hypothetical protein